jgi:hypothetical protein
MGWFSGNKQLPETTYGYQPPPEATASGWQCNNKDCGTGDAPAPKKWPARCPLCGGLADPDFDAPWREEARGYRLQMLAKQDGDEFGIFESGIREWRYGQALARSDVAGAEATRRDTDRWLVHMSRQSPYFRVGSVRFMLIHHAVKYQQIDAAARELTDWFAAADVYNVDYSPLGESSEEGNRMRSELFPLFRSAIGFLERTEGRAHPLAPAIDKAARRSTRWHWIFVTSGRR